MILYRAKQLYAALYAYISIVEYTPNKEPYIFMSFFDRTKNAEYSFACVCRNNFTANWYDIVSQPAMLSSGHVSPLIARSCGYPTIRVICHASDITKLQSLSNGRVGIL